MRLRLFPKMREIRCFSSLGLLVLCVCINVDLILILENNFIYLFLAVPGLCCCMGFSSSCSERGLLSRCGGQASHCCCFSSCGAQALGCRGFSSCGTWTHSCSSLALQHRLSWHVGSSRIRDRTSVSYIGRWILHHWATRGALLLIFIYFSKLVLKYSCFTMLC